MLTINVKINFINKLDGRRLFPDRAKQRKSGGPAGFGRLKYKKADYGSTQPASSPIQFNKVFLFQSGLGGAPMDVFKKSLDVVRPFQPVIDHESVFEDIHDQQGIAPGRVGDIVFVDPEID
jgi:hypothetical protein